MNDPKTINAAWEIYNLIDKLANLIWDQFEDEFIQRSLQSQEDKYLEDQLNLSFQSDHI